MRDRTRSRGRFLSASDWSPDLLSGLHSAPAIALCRSLNLLWQDAAKTTIATAANDPVRVVKCPFTGVEFTAPSDAARPLLTNPAGAIWCLTFDGVNDCMDFAGLASKPLSAHFGVRWTGANAAAVFITGPAGSQKFKGESGLGDHSMEGGREAAYNWSSSSAGLAPNTDFVGALDYAATGAALYYQDGAGYGTADADVSDDTFTADVTRIGLNTSGDEEWIGRFYGWALLSASQSAANILRLHQWLAGYQGRSL